MAKAKTVKVVDTLDYAELLKGATKTVTVDLPSQSGTLDKIREKNELALRDAGWNGEEYTIIPPKYQYQYSYYTNSYLSPAKAKFERLLTAEEIAADGPKLYKQKLAAEKKAAVKRKKDIAKLRELQTTLGLPLYEGT